ncbi:hypothetical protein OROHE_014137 [Orobanche hederae]
MEEEDYVNKPCSLHDCLALQVAEESLCDTRNSVYPMYDLESSVSSSAHNLLSFGSSQSYTTTNNNSKEQMGLQISPSSTFYYDFFRQYTEDARDHSPNNTKEKKKNRCTEEDSPFTQERSQVIKKKKKKKKPNDRQQDFMVEKFDDLKSLLTKCAEAVAGFDRRTVNDLLMQIRQRSSPQGDAIERIAHYFANALQARFAGTVSYVVFKLNRILIAEISKIYETYITACPFKKMSNYLANKTIEKLAIGATTLHIIDFGILYGYQWPCLIEALSQIPGGPPKLRITGIDFPQPGSHPAETIEDTGHRLGEYCRRFGVPFEYNAIAKKWDTIRVEDVRIEKNELIAANSLYRLHNVLDEAVRVSGPRDDVLRLIKKINPDMYVYGAVSGTYNTPFFVPRFREAFFHLYSIFDMFDATTPRQDENRLRIEQTLGEQAFNVIACEGTARIERPETYKQWQVRHMRAGFMQIRFDQEIVKHVRSKVRMDYHKEFSVEEDEKWMLQEWKGRVILAISCWQPAPQLN